jgi:hypothetical protein
MVTRRLASRSAALLSLVLASAVGLAFAQGWRGKGHGGDGNLWLLARAGGVSQATLASSFHGNSTLQGDFTSLKSARQTLISCLTTTPGSCSSQINGYAKAQSQLTTDKMNAWATVFAGAPNLSNASTLVGQLQQLQSQEQNLRQQRHQILKGVFGGSSGSGSTATE